MHPPCQAHDLHKIVSEEATMRIAISGSHGFICSKLKKYLEAQGHSVLQLVRQKPDPLDLAIEWNPKTGYIDMECLKDVEGIVHLAGENIFGPWTNKKKI